MRVTSRVRKFSVKTLIASSALALLTAAPAKAAVIPLYNQSFDAALGAEWTGVTTITGVPAGYALIGFSGSMLRNIAFNPPIATVLTLTGLPTHESVDINFLLAVIDSWDGIGGNPGPDTFVVRVDGVERFNKVFAVQSGADSPGVPADLGPLQNRGFSTFNDRGFDMGTVSSLNFAHTNSTLVIEFFTLATGWQGGDDESWGLDSLGITLGTQDGPTPPGVPEPATLSLLGAGLLAAAYRRRN